MLPRLSKTDLICFVTAILPMAFVALAWLTTGSESNAAEEDVLTPTENSNLDPLDLDERFGLYVTKEEFESTLKKMTWKKGDFSFTPYGILWVNTAYDTSATIPGEFSLYSQSKELDGEPYYALDARTSRIGLFIDGPEIESLPGTKVRGVFEVDFQGLCNTSRNKGGLQLRKAFVEFVNKEKQSKIVIGEDWEIISPLYPQMLAYLPGGFAGNIGYRRAQIRYEKGHTLSCNFKTLSQIGLADDFIGDYTTTAGVSGKPSGVPLVEARYAVSLWEQARCGLPITLGFSGHYGQDRYNFSPIAGTYLDTAEKNKTIKTWSLNFDLDFPLNKKLRLQGEYYYGENLSTFCGGINQGVDLIRREGIRDQGAWMALQTKISDHLTNNTGYNIDTPIEDDLVGTVLPTNGITYARTKNQVIFTNFLYNWSAALMTGIELSYWKTDFRKADISSETPVFLPMKAGETFRTELVMKYTF